MLDTLLDGADATGKKKGKTSCFWRISVVVLGDGYVNHRDRACQGAISAGEKRRAGEGTGVGLVMTGVPVTLWRAWDRRLAATEGRGAKKCKKMSRGGLKADSGGEAVGTDGLERWKVGTLPEVCRVQGLFLNSLKC